MSRGDATADLVTLSGSETLSVKPSGSAEWIVHNIYHGNDALVEVTDGTNSVSADSHSGEGSFVSYQWHLTSAHYIKVSNTTSSSATDIYGYDGIISQV